MPPIAKCVQIQQANPFFPNLPFTQPPQLIVMCGTVLCFVTTIGRLGYLGCNFLSHTLLFTLIKSFFPDKFGTDETPPTRDLRLPELVKNLDLAMEDQRKGELFPFQHKFYRNVLILLLIAIIELIYRIFENDFISRLSYILVQYRFQF